MIIIITEKIMINKLSTIKIGTNQRIIVGAKIQFILNFRYKYIAIIYIINVMSKIFNSVIIALSF